MTHPFPPSAHPRAGTIRHLFAQLAVLAAATALTACGGGSSTEPQSPPPPPPIQESTYVLAGLAGTSATPDLVVWEPTAPSTRLASQPGVIPASLAWSDATTYDATSRTHTFVAHALALAIHDGVLVKVDLRGGHPHAATPLTTALGLDFVVGVVPLDATGLDAWVMVDSPTRRYLLRTTWDASHAPIAFSRDAMIEDHLDDPVTGSPVGLVLHRGFPLGSPTQLAVVDAQDAASTWVASSSASDSWLGIDPANPTTGFYQSGDAVLRLDWASIPATTGSSPVASLNGLGAVPVGADGASVYYANGLDVMAITGGVAAKAASLPALPADSGYYYSFERVAGDHLAVRKRIDVAPQCCVSWLTLRLSDGTVTPLPDADFQGLDLVANTPEWLVFAGRLDLYLGDLARWTTVRMVHPDGSGTLAPGQLAGLVRSRQSALGGSAPVTSLVTCNSDYSHFVECIPGSVQQLSLSDGSVLALGDLAGQAWGGTLFDGYDGVPTAVTWIADTQSTTWQFVPGQAGSLAPVAAAAAAR